MVREGHYRQTSIVAPAGVILHAISSVANCEHREDNRNHHGDAAGEISDKMIFTDCPEVADHSRRFGKDKPVNKPMN
jgi:hypothetical protein